MRVTDLWVYPVKSLGGYVTEQATVEPWGLVGDRRWMLVDPAGEPVTAREVHALLRLTAEQVNEETIRITDRADGASILVDTPLGLPPVPVGLSRQASAAPADADVGEWVSDRVGRTVRLVWQEDPTARTLSGARGGLPGETLSLADAGPVLLTSQTSMARLNDWIGADADQPDVPDIDPEDLSGPATGPAGALDIRRFRPNVVIDGEAPFAEDSWARVRVGDVELRQTMICDRCVMTTIDPDTLEGGKEPIRTLARHRRWDRKTWFGVRLVRVGGGTDLHVGDAVEPL